MLDPRADELIARYLLEDKSKQVRLSAIESADLREPTEVMVAALAKAATQSDETHVRYRAVELLIRWLPKRPDVRGALERVAQKDEEAKVRDRARKAL
jgi:hypothetical protein